MTDITINISQIQTRRFSLKFPRLGVGKALNAIGEALGNAFSLAYVEPFNPTRRRDDERI